MVEKQQLGSGCFVLVRLSGRVRLLPPFPSLRQLGLL